MDKAIYELRRAIFALYLQIDSSIVEDINNRVEVLLKFYKDEIEKWKSGNRVLNIQLENSSEENHKLSLEIAKLDKEISNLKQIISDRAENLSHKLNNNDQIP